MILISFWAGIIAAVKVPQKSVVITYPQSTPGWVLDKAKEAIISAGGFITHEYHIFKGFAATAPAKAFEIVGSLSTEYAPTIEEDQIVSVQE